MKPHCEETLSELATYLDGELTEEVRVKIAVHLEECPPCGEIAVFQAELKQVIRSKCVDRVPDELRARILEACTEDPAAS
jgi:mycothiol system anti-sigma-R factor